MKEAALSLTYYELIEACTKLWRRRKQHRALLLAIVGAVEATVRECVGCGKPMRRSDPRTLHCSRMCAQRHRRANARLKI